jgi:hypothetical protein
MGHDSRAPEGDLKTPLGGEPEGVFFYEGEVELMSTNKYFRILRLISIALIFCFATPSQAMDVTLAWDANT